MLPAVTVRLLVLLAPIAAVEFVQLANALAPRVKSFAILNAFPWEIISVEAAIFHAICLKLAALMHALIKQKIH